MKAQRCWWYSMRSDYSVMTAHIKKGQKPGKRKLPEIYSGQNIYTMNSNTSRSKKVGAKLSARPGSKKPKNPRPKLYMMVLYWLLILLFLFAVFMKIRHFYHSHWNRQETSALITLKNRLLYKPVTLRFWLSGFQGRPLCHYFR